MPAFRPPRSSPPPPFQLFFPSFPRFVISPRTKRADYHDERGLSYISWIIARLTIANPAEGSFALIDLRSLDSSIERFGFLPVARFLRRRSGEFSRVRNPNGAKAKADHRVSFARETPTDHRPRKRSRNEALPATTGSHAHAEERDELRRRFRRRGHVAVVSRDSSLSSSLSLSLSFSLSLARALSIGLPSREHVRLTIHPSVCLLPVLSLEFAGEDVETSRAFSGESYARAPTCFLSSRMI